MTPERESDHDARFQSRIYYDTTGRGCWLWTEALDRDGRGRLSINNRDVMVHRYAWQRLHGAIPAGMCVCHRCDTPSCVNTDHMFLGTQADNTADKVAKGRQARISGERNHSAKLTATQVQRIRSVYAGGGVRQRELADEYGVRQTLISQIVRNQIWRTVS